MPFPTGARGLAWIVCGANLTTMLTSPTARSWPRAICAHLTLSVIAAACAGRSAGPPAAPTQAVADGGATPSAAVQHPPITEESSGAQDATRVLPGDRSAFSAAVAKVMPGVGNFARASGHDGIVAAGDLLEKLAAAIETIPDPKLRARDAIAEVRFEAQRLQRSDRLAFGVAKWIKLGLASSLDGLLALVPANDSGRFWIASARQAQDAIDISSTSTFQRAVIQDAIRTTVTAFVIAGQGLEICD